MAAEGDFLLRYRAVSNKLKKRFLRKPNVSEASEQFGQLAKELKQQDCLQYAGFCNLAMARCEQTLFNAPGEAMALTEAARLFLQAEKETHRLRCPGFEEHLQAAINCYSFAIKVYIELSQPIMAASLCLEVGNALKEMNKPGEAVVYFQRASELQTQVPIECLLSLGYVASCKILTRDYDGALAIFTEMQLLAQEKGLQTPGSCTPVGAFLDVIAKCEISRVLLLLLLQPPPQKLLPEHAQTLEKYDWESFDSHSQVNYLSENVFLLLQSVVMANQEKDVESMKILQVELWPLLTQEQNHLLHLVLQELISPSGQGV
ncbi:40-kDa huntingtin-associated protein isoform X1 [Latimeria chalumnae]|uniref:Coagulation factor VIII associated n=2 Tax=Latimeria chalumnae TaxID=7897 RepID=H3AAP2_LATCH|nr:PREDICTED: factor VIII intron 22 protein-like [Latimeria chalumnae]|eukprot:XP_006011847.1 PREDICTED: factor VIII intron 22 protein-like [Latimeria chalumnae]